MFSLSSSSSSSSSPIPISRIEYNNVISVYAHKGGVGKSTICLEIAIELTKKGYSVVIIDADPQLNTTFKLLKRNNDVGYDRESQYRTLNSFLNQTVESRVETWNGFTYKTLYNYMQGEEFTNEDLIKVNEAKKLYFIMGTPKLDELSYDIQVTDLTSEKIKFRNLIININKCFKKSKIKIIVDMAPGITYINQNILLSTNKLYIPCTPDDNSCISLNLLLLYYNLWRRNHLYLDSNLIIAGIIFNAYKYKRDGDEGMSNACENIYLDIKEILKHHKKELKFKIKLFKIQSGMRFSEVCSSEFKTMSELNSKICLNSNTAFDRSKVNSFIEEINLIVNDIIENE